MDLSPNHWTYRLKSSSTKAIPQIPGPDISNVCCAYPNAHILSLYKKTLLSVEISEQQQKELREFIQRM